MDSSGAFTVTAEAGLGDDFLIMNDYLKRGNLPQCIRQALEQTEFITIENPASACRGCPLAGKYLDGGGVGGVIKYGGKGYGVIIASCPREFMSDVEEGLLIEVAGDIAFALHNLEMEEDKKVGEEALRKSEARYRLLAENATDVIWTADMNFRLTYISPSVTALRGHSVEETMVQPPEETFAPASLELVMKVLAEEAEEGYPSRSRTVEVELYCKDGSTLWTEIKASCLRDPDGRAVGILGATRDISERRQAQEGLARIAAELKEFINTANAPIFGINKEGRINEWNQAAERITGFTKDEVMGKDLMEDFITKDYEASVAEVLANALKGEETANFEFPLYSKGGKRLMILLNATTRRDYSGNIVGAMGVGQDVTELTEYRESLEQRVTERTAELNRALYDTEEARGRIDGILKSVADGLIVTDIYNRVILMNRAAEELLGMRLSEVIDRSIDFAIQDETLRERIKVTLEKKEKGEKFDFELPAEGEDEGHPRIIRARTSMILDRRGKERGIITIMHDVTYEREVDRMKTEFISTAAHQLRTPLTSIQGFSEILLRRDELKEEEKKKFLFYINKQAITLGRIVSDLLDISRIESGYGFALDKVKHYPGEFIKGIIQYFQNISARHHFEVGLEDKLVELLIDKDKMEQALMNIIDNAVKYSPEGGTIRMAGEGFEDYYHVSVEDQGIGMTPEQLGKIFDN
ncbi:MAG TPA: PAS domain S-box protein, partial [Thermodesulfobacteriota bacterium]|nr:PAS domain S-box protein [Thermodesulfobacteriota bacterium]